MTNCTDCRSLLVDYERGELDSARDAEMYAHLQSCEACRTQWHADLAVVDALRTRFAEREFPASALAGVRLAMHASPAPTFLERIQTTFRPWVAAPVAAALLIAGVVVGYEHAHPAAQPTLAGIDYVREHVALTAGLPSSDRAWSTYVLTSANAGDNADAGSQPNT